MTTQKTYRPWEPHQTYLLPSSPDEWLPEGHLAHFILDVVGELDLSAIIDTIQEKDPRGTRPYHPMMMVAVLLYGSCIGVVSSRRIERATYEDVAFRVIAGGAHPHFTTICEFRVTHFEALAGLFRQVVQLCQAAGLVNLGHVSCDGSKVKANASKHRAMSYDRMQSEKERIEAEVRALLEHGVAVDAAEDELYGPGNQPSDLPEELRRREGRLAKIREAMAAMRDEARATRADELRKQAERSLRTARSHPDPVVRKRARTNAAKRDAAARKLSERNERDSEDKDEPPQGGSGGATSELPLFAALPAPEDDSALECTRDTATALPRHQTPATPDGAPRPQAQRNFTDPDSRIMEHQGGFIQAYNAQIAVDDKHQVIVAQAMTNQAPDTYHLVPLLERAEATCGTLPDKVTADTGYWAPTNAQWCEDHGVDAYIATGRMKRGWAIEAPCRGVAPEEADARERMRHKINTAEGRAVYRLRKCVPEPVFGQIKEARGLRQLLHRGIDRVRCEWALNCTGHNLLKLFKATPNGRLVPAWAR
jgi:transposase